MRSMSDTLDSLQSIFGVLAVIRTDDFLLRSISIGERLLSSKIGMFWLCSDAVKRIQPNPDETALIQEAHIYSSRLQ